MRSYVFSIVPCYRYFVSYLHTGGGNDNMTHRGFSLGPGSDIRKKKNGPRGGNRKIYEACRGKFVAF